MTKKLLILLIMLMASLPASEILSPVEVFASEPLFGTRIDYGAGYVPVSVFCADLDGDTDLDLAVANTGSYNVSILKNNGDGTYQTAENFGVGDHPWSVFCADLDGDNDLDLAVASGLSGVCILKNLSNPSFVRGDANGDRIINVVDVVYLINYVYIDGPAPHPLQAGDANSDRVVDITDVVYLIKYLFLGGPPPGY